MKLLFLSINYAPEPTGFAPHVAALCEHLVARGHLVTVITGFPFAPYWSRWPDYRGKIVSRQVIKGVDVRRVSHFVPRRAGQVWQRLWMEGSFCLMAAAVLASGLRRRHFDLVVYVGAQPSIAMLARLTAGLRRVPYVVEINDLAAEAAVDVGMVRARWLRRCLVTFEHMAYRRAAGATVLCPSFKDALTAQHYPADQIRIIRSPVDIEQIRPVSSGLEFRRAHNLGLDDFVVLFAGSMGLKQGLSNVVEAARLLKAEQPLVKWVLVGDGELKPAIENLIVDYGLNETIRLLPLQPESEMSAMFSAADVLLLNQLRTVKDTVISSKLLTYMAAGRPVVAAVNASSQGAVLLREAQGNGIIQPDNPAALAQAVQTLIPLQAERRLMGARNRAYAEQHFDQRKILVVQEEFLQAIVDRRR